MSNLETLLDDAIGDLQPSFDLADIQAQGSALRRSTRRRTAMARVAAAVVFVLLVPLVATFVRPPEPVTLSTQVQSSARFVKQGPDSGALLHLPGIFDEKPVPRDEWPAGVAEVIGEWSRLWRSDDDKTLVSLHVEADEVCLIETNANADGVLPSCHSLHELALSGVIQARSQRTVLLAEGATGHDVDQVVRSAGGRHRAGLIQLDGPVTGRELPDLMSALAIGSVGGEGTSVQWIIDGADASAWTPQLASCVRTDAGVSAEVNTEEGTLRLHSSGTGLTSSLVRTSGLPRVQIGVGSRLSFSAVVFMEPGASATELTAVEKQLRANPRTSDFVYWDQRDAYEEFEQLFAGEPNVSVSIGIDDLPSSFRLRGDMAKGELAAALEPIGSLPGVFQIVQPGWGPSLAGPFDDVHVAAASAGSNVFLHAHLMSGGEHVEIMVECGSDHLDARTARRASLSPRRSQIVALAPNDRVGTLDIPTIGLQIEITRGVRSTMLQESAGSYLGTPPPGVEGNAAIAAHRTAYGAPILALDQLRTGDHIIAATRDGRFIYRVTDRQVVLPTAVDVLGDYGDDRLTLTTEVSPFSTDNRLVITALLLGEARISDVDWSLESQPVTLE